LIYLDHNATTPVHPCVINAMAPFLRVYWGNPSSPHRVGREARLAIDRAKERIAQCLGCRRAELVFTAGGTEADNLAIRGVAGALKGRGNHVVTTAIEHHAVLHTCKALEADGFRTTYLPVDSNGVVNVDALVRSLTPETILVSVMHANNETGVIQPVEHIAEEVRKRGIIFHIDAVQTAGKIPFQISRLGAHLVAISGHKVYGPKGIGILYIEQGTPLLPLITGGAQENGLRAGTENVAAIVGLSEAIVLADSALKTEEHRLSRLRDQLESRLHKNLSGFIVNGGSVPRVPNTSNLSFHRVDGESIVLALELSDICISTGSACSTGDPEPSHVLLAMGLSPERAQGSIRVSLGKETEEKDIEVTVGALVTAIGKLRNISSVS
jgi:cysteine desulfurase